MLRRHLAWSVIAAIALACATAHAVEISQTLGLAVNKTCSEPGKLVVNRTDAGQVIEVDLSALPEGAKLHKAALLVDRPGRGLESREPEWLRPILIYTLPAAAAAAAATQPADKPLSLEGPWFRSFDVTVQLAKAIVAKDKTVRFLVKEFFRWNPNATELAITYDVGANAASMPAGLADVPQAKAVKAFHKDGNTFITWQETEKLVDQDEPTIGDIAAIRAKLAQADKTRKLRYRVLRHTEPITAANVAQATALVDVSPLSCINIDGGMDHWGRDKEPQNRLVILEGQEKLPWNTGLYVDVWLASPKYGGSLAKQKQRTSCYAVVTVVNGLANLKDISPDNAPAQAVTEQPAVHPMPVLQYDSKEGKNPFGGVRENARVRLYVAWNAEPFYNLPNQTYNWAVTIDEKQLANPAPVGLYLHEWAGTHVRTTWGWPGGRTGILVSGNDFPPQSWWYGQHEALGTLKSWSDGKVHNYTERRVLAFLDWVGTQWPVDKNHVYAAGGSMGGSGVYTFALRNGDRFAMISGNVGVANWPMRGHFTTAMEICTGYFEWKLPTSDGPTTDQRLSMSWWLRNNPTVETPFLSAGNGKDDGAIGWAQAVEFYKALQETKRPHAAYWGMRGHGTPAAGMPIDQKRSQQFRLDQTLPAFTRCSLDGNFGAGKKLDTPQETKNGDGKPAKDAFDGDSEGYLNQYLRWETADEQVIDEPKAWGLTVFLVKSCPQEQCSVEITPRRCQKFKAAAEQKLKWINTDSEGKQVQTGQAQADKNGLVTMEKAIVSKGGNKILLTAE